MSQSQGSQGDRSSNINNVGDVNIDASQENRSVQIEGNPVEGAVYAGEIKGSSYTRGNTYVNSPHVQVLPPPPPLKPDFPHNLKQVYSLHFVGRGEDLEELHQKLQNREWVEITAASSIASIEGMGGIGKTELALQYALRYGEAHYGAVMWLDVLGRDVGLQIVDFARDRLGWVLPENPEIVNLVRSCWSRQPKNETLLIIFDDVWEYEDIAPFLPPNDSRFKIVITTRQQGLAGSFRPLGLDLLSEEASLSLLRSLVGEERMGAELETAKSLCEMLGYLPLALELIGYYLKRRPKKGLQAVREALEKQGLAQRGLQDPKTVITAKRGVRAAFELSWQGLKEEAQSLAMQLSAFAAAPIFWEWVEKCNPDEDMEDLEEWRDEELLAQHLLTLEGESYELHPLVREFLAEKRQVWEGNAGWIERFCEVMVEEAETLPHPPTLVQLQEFAKVLPHVEIIARDYCSSIGDEDLIIPFTQIALYYKGQGFYSQAEPWIEKCLSVVRDRLGEEHPDVATSLNNLAELHHSQGKYKEAETLYLQALELGKQIFGKKHSNVAIFLNNLAKSYKSQGKYKEAETLYLQALELGKQIFGKKHSNVAIFLNNLAGLYESQGRYEEAEPLYLQTLERLKELLGEEHPNFANSLNNLALLYKSQERYEDAEPLFLKALELLEKILGEDHPDFASSLSNLALLYRAQGRYEDAEPLYLKALKLRKKILGEKHPDVAISLNNLAELHKAQGRDEDVEPLYLQAIDIFSNRLGDEHPNTQNVRENFKYFLQSVVAAGKKDKLSNHPLTQQLLAQIEAQEE